MRSTLLHTIHQSVDHDPGVRVVIVQRTAAPFTSSDQIRASHEAIEAALVGVPRETHSLVYDVRRAPLRNDPVYETVTAPYRRRILKGFARRIVLVATPLGRIQVMRHASTDPFPPEVSDDPDEVLALLRLSGRFKI